MAEHLEVTVNRPIEDVFAVLTDPGQTAKWFPVRVEERWTSPPPHGVGSTRHAVVHAFGRRVENDATITEYQRPCRGACEVESSGVKLNVALDFTPLDGGTRVLVSFGARAGRFMRIAVAPFMGWYVRK
jgi:uncharacterized protein YndB with AHSA1/START domain